MHLTAIKPYQIGNSFTKKTEKHSHQSNTSYVSSNTNPFKSVPLSYQFNSNISFSGKYIDDINRAVPDINYEDYQAMKDTTKLRFRKIYSNFHSDDTIDKNELFDKKISMLPLRTEKDMDDFIEISKIYNKYKDHPIICLGRSPKWFLNASLWMKDGISNYDFVAFSKFWYRKDPYEGMKRMDRYAPTEKEEVAYRKYLKSLRVDPKSIVKKMQETGKQTIITDYICTGKGACSFLDVMSRFAEEQGVLEEFSKSIKIVGIGSMKYMETMCHEDEDVSEPEVPMPELLRPYKKNIKQEFYDMKYNVFEDMLLNQNTNECRSTYYPHENWTVYRPDKFKTGLVKDIRVVKKKMKDLKDGVRSQAPFTPAMADYRNLVNFRILDGLHQRGLLKTEHVSKI